MKRIYIAGPISNIPDGNFSAFAEADAALRAAGWLVSNPHVVCAHLPASSTTWTTYMRHCVRALSHCDAVALLPGYEKSKGAMAELNLAVALGLDVRTIAEWLSVEVAA